MIAINPGVLVPANRDHHGWVVRHSVVIDNSQFLAHVHICILPSRWNRIAEICTGRIQVRIVEWFQGLVEPWLLRTWCCRRSWRSALISRDVFRLDDSCCAGQGVDDDWTKAQYRVAGLQCVLAAVLRDGVNDCVGHGCAPEMMVLMNQGRNEAGLPCCASGLLLLSCDVMLSPRDGLFILHLKDSGAEPFK
ncbi:hypothetical protein EVJ50_01430 [Synechococcus sp. RSCCF101]|uniref:hypothetical protein n=1 Tax=Synechococcus sp. RSCCF101 TaxID=2511069 RepID=UPI001246C039|nr:hypothetical protein [Synechococcus sp. RSCCF101]QEY31113.1 hypothetical protein EVJ50_01430 [Synechococcus sp. RSCCF101]